MLHDTDSTAADIQLHQFGIIFVLAQYCHYLVGISDRTVLQAKKILLTYISISGSEECLDERSVDQDTVLIHDIVLRGNHALLHAHFFCIAAAGYGRFIIHIHYVDSSVADVCHHTEPTHVLDMLQNRRISLRTDSTAHYSDMIGLFPVCEDHFIMLREI